MGAITQEQFDKLYYNDDITKREYDEIIGLIHARVDEVWCAILKQQNRELGWYDFDNGGTEDHHGYFDPRCYQQDIPLIGEWDGWLEDENPFCDGFPTRFLWEENFLDQAKEETKKYKKAEAEKKAEAKRKAEEAKERKAKFRKIIKAKLTKEELKYISFK